MKTRRRAASSTRSRRSSSRTPDAAFFHEELAARPFFGGGAVDAGMLSPALFDGTEHEWAERLASSTPPHVVIPDALPAAFARALAQNLRRARFVPHHHAPYPLQIAPAPTGELRRFTSWLGTGEAARLHLKLAGMRTDRRLQQIQVQVSRMTAGEHFPPHIDTDQDALACIYNLSVGFGLDDGGELVFLDDADGPLAVVPPWFNSLCLFASRNVPHAVEAVRSRRKRRHSVTVFYILD